MWTELETPVGVLRLVGRGGAITAIEFPVDAEGFAPTSSAGRAAAASAGRPVGERDDQHPLLREAAGQLEAYFARDLKEFDLPLAPSGSAFQQRVWGELRRIGYGQTASYGDIAARLGRSNAASRAVGLANGRNPLPIVVPCHRVIGSDGTLVGYAGGLERKRYLLGLEQDALF